MASWLKSDTSIRVASGIGSIVVRILLASIRWRTIDKGGLESLKLDGDAAIFVNWHCRLLGVFDMLRPYNIKGVVSPSTDGKFISGVVGPLGIRTIWGSSNRNTIGAYREMRKSLKDGEHVGITPDGPRGPARMAALGTLALAKTSGARIIPLAYSTSRMARLGTWDRFVVPKPFSAGVQLWGEPITVPADISDAALEKARLRLEDALNALTAEADAMFGHKADHTEHRYGKGKEKR